MISKLLTGVRINGLRGQIALLVLLSLIGTQALIAATFLLRGPTQFGPNDHQRRQFELSVLLIATTPAEQRPLLVKQIDTAFPRLQMTLRDAAGVPPQSHHTTHALNEVARELGPLARVYGVEEPRGELKVAIGLMDGTTIVAQIPERRSRPPFWGGPWMTALLGVVVSLAVFALWADRGLSTPLSAFATSAENFKLDGGDDPLPETGPEEIRALARALNRSRSRIKALIDDRTRTLAAIGHDLRTPITRLRLRSEFIEDPAQREHMLRDLDQMRSMLDAVLSFLRDGHNHEAKTRIDLASALHSIADQFADLGHCVSYQGPEHAEALARPDDLHRAVTNLIDNAVRYGKTVIVRLAASPQRMVIDVEDDGPGIPDTRKARLIEPFVRGDDARNMNEASGFGLGLSIARAIAESHGGELSLHDRAPHGLIVRITLPHAATDRAA